jgi:hypothetical protein
VNRYVVEIFLAVQNFERELKPGQDLLVRVHVNDRLEKQFCCMKLVNVTVKVMINDGTLEYRSQYMRCDAASF